MRRRARRRGECTRLETPALRFAPGDRVLMDDGGCDGALGTVLSFGRTRYLVRLDDHDANGRRAGLWMRVPECRLQPTELPAPSPRRSPTRFTRRTPSWARDLVLEVLREYDVGLGEVCWRPAPSGRRVGRLGTAAGRRRVVVRDNRGERDQRMTLLHELAHVIVDDPRHGPDFWDVCWALYRDHGVDLAAALAATSGRRFAAASHRRVIGPAS